MPAVRISADSGSSAATRFLVEVAAWIAGPWWAHRGGGWWLAVPVAIVLIGVPAAFNTPGDKQVSGIPTAGWVRIVIEVVLFAIAAVGVWVLVARPLATAFGMFVIVAAVSQWPRWRWLAGVRLSS